MKWFFLVLVWCSGVMAMAQTIRGREGIVLPSPPPVEADPVTDDYFGTKITDSYRWLEDAKSTQTRAFIDAENTYTSRYLKQAKIRNQILDDLDPLENVSQTTTPRERAGSFFFEKRLARRAAVLHLRAPRIRGQGRAAHRSRLHEPRSQHVGVHRRRLPRRRPHCLRPEGGRRRRKQHPRLRCEDQEDPRR